jgi:integrase
MVWTVAHVKKIRNRPRKPHQVPITPPILAVLEELQARRTDPSPDAPILPKDDGTTRHYSTLATWIRDTLKWEPHVDAHGFRSTLRDWCRANRFQDELWNFQVNQAQGNAVSQAYGHDTMIEQRRDMMTKWGEYCSTPPAEPQSIDVINLAERRR